MPEPETQTDARRLRILLVEDDEDDYVIVRKLLSSVEGNRYELSWARSCEDAQEAMKRDEYDLYLVDYLLGAQNGLELLRWATDSGVRAPIILLTGRGDSKVDMEAMRSGAADYLVKGKLDAAILERSMRYAIERVQTLDALRKSEERFRAIVETTPIPKMIIRVSDSAILYANDSLVLLLGIPIQKLVGSCASSFYSLLDDAQPMLDELTATGSLDNCEMQGKTTDRKPFWVSISARQIVFEGKQAMLMGIYNITSQKQAEQEMIRLERLGALGEISAGVSHNLNNLLVGILGPAQALKRRTQDPRLLQLAEDIITSSRRARDLVDRLHRAARADEEEALQPVDVNQVVKEAVRAAQPRWKDGPEAQGIPIKVAVNLDTTIPHVRATASLLHDMVLNLLFNAVDAMQGGGQIHIETGSQDTQVTLLVRDTGIGMDENTRARIFEPFFTTKKSVGTGLGLYTVYSTMARLGGSITVDTAPEQGTCFMLKLVPWTERNMPPEKKQEKTPPGRRGKVLVIDDNALVRKALPFLLSETHTVETAKDAPEALTKIEAERFDVVLIDLGLPGMPGDQAAKQIKNIDPAVATVLITSWKVGATDPRRSAFDFCIPKPFDKEDEVRATIAQAVALHDTRVKTANLAKIEADSGASEQQ